MRTFILIFLSTLYSFSTTFQTRAAEKPNILFIAIDDQNDWIGCLNGHPLAHTPNIDRLAAGGTLFTNAHCQSPLCNPSRTSLMIGMRPSSTGIYGLAPWFRNVPELASSVTLPQHLAKHGYTTYSTGKIYHGRYGRQSDSKEFHHLGPPGGVGIRPENPLVNTPSGHPLVDWGVFPHKDEQKQDYKVAQYAVDTLKSNPQEPFFLAVGFFLPHVPCYTTQKWYDLFPDDDSVLPKVIADDRDDTPRFSWYLHWKLPECRLKFLQDENQWHNLARSYLACTAFIDSQVGRVIEQLENSGYRKNTIIVLWSDHGWHIGEKAITGKNTLWADGTRVPLIFAGPGITSGQVSAQPAELLDIYPTLSELIDTKVGSQLEGHSLLPQLKDVTAKREHPAITTHNHDNHAIRTTRWRYITYADGTAELYDTLVDPHEWHNLADKAMYQGVIADLRKWIPKTNKKPVKNSSHRILLYDDGKVNWEGKDIPADAPIPEI
ncbi:MAG TPA: choline-sulfatase [Planctomycetes bacterium]|nr:choline-sulfatase [Planctomycetaceae bacterium]HIN55101.1 choline-sulfatase [Planctomycetota bacterium]